MEQHSEVAAVVPRSWDRPAVAVPVLAALSVVGGQLPSFSTPANLYILGIGGALVWLSVSGRLPRRAAPRALGVRTLWWLLPAGLFGLLEGVTLVLGHSTLSLLADPLLEHEAARSVGYFGWLAAFWGLVRVAAAPSKAVPR